MKLCQAETYSNKLQFLKKKNWDGKSLPFIFFYFTLILMKYIKNKEFTKVRGWVVENIESDITPLFRKIYDTMSLYVAPSSIPFVVVTLADYQYKSAFVADQEINMVACLTEIMVECEFK